MITNMINLSFESGEFASDWKEALLKPLLKKCGLDIAFHNFRPVSNLPYVSKLSEKAAANQLIDHVTTNDLHMPLQSAYKQNHSTESALLKVKNDILLNMEAQKVTLLVLLDLSAAFDTVRHDTLLNRLKSRFGVDGKALEWFASYLADRTQRVTVNDGLSSAFPLDKEFLKGVVSGLSCLRSTPVSCLISSASTSQVYTATQMTHNCIWHSVLMCKGRTRPRYMLCVTAYMT